MAEAKAATGKKPSTRKSPKAMVADRGMKGAMALMIQEAFKIGFGSNYEGTTLENKNAAGELLEANRQSSMLSRLTGEGMIVDKMDDKGENYKKLYAFSKAAHGDIATDEQKYSKAVKDLINFCCTLKTPSESKISALKSIVFK